MLKANQPRVRNPSCLRPSQRKSIAIIAVDATANKIQYKIDNIHSQLNHMRISHI